MFTELLEINLRLIGCCLYVGYKLLHCVVDAILSALGRQLDRSFPIQIEGGRQRHLLSALKKAVSFTYFLSLLVLL